MRRSYKYLLIGALVTAVLILCLLVLTYDQPLKIVFCDVGQGDSIYLGVGGMDVLVDGGANNQVLECLGRYMPFYDRQIELLFMTHPQQDHIGGLVEVVKRYRIKYIVTVPVSHTIDAYKELQKLTLSKNIPVKYLTAGDGISLGKLSFEVFWPAEAYLDDVFGEQAVREVIANPSGGLQGMGTDLDLNIFSLYLGFHYQDFDLLLTGDGDLQTQKLVDEFDLASEIEKTDFEIIKIPHHGSQTAISSEFLNQVRAEVAIIQLGGKNNYGHPHQDLLGKLKQLKLYRTDQQGDIVVTVSKDNSYTIKTERK